jgi:hypothetical protein
MSARSTVALFGVPLARPPRRSPFDAPCGIENFYYFRSNSESALKVYLRKGLSAKGGRADELREHFLRIGRCLTGSEMIPTTASALEIGLLSRKVQEAVRLTR